MALTKVPSNLDATVSITQSASDNSTNIATTAYVTTAIANLVDGAPSTLNTLDEIAAALNDDAALNTTLTNSIATKLPLAGGTMSGVLSIVTPSSTTSSLTLTETGAVTSSFNATGSVGSIGSVSNHPFNIIQNNTPRISINTSGHVGIQGTDLQLNSVNPRIDFDNNDSSGSLRLYSTSASAERLNLGSTGKLTLTTPAAGTVGYLNIKDNGNGDIRFGKESGATYDAIAGTWTNNGFAMYTNSQQRFTIHAGGEVVVGAAGTGPDNRLFTVEGAGDLMQLRSTNSGAGGAQLDLIHDSASPADGDNVGIINFSNATRQFASVTGKSASSSQGALHLGVRTDASNYNHNALVIDHNGDIDISGKLHIGTALSDTRLTLGSTGTENTNSSSWVRSSSGNLMYNAGSSSHIWELAGAQKMNLASTGLLTFVGSANTEGISFGSNHRIYGGSNRALEFSSSATGQISIGEGYPHGTIKAYSKFQLGTFNASQTNSGEAWIGRAHDRQDGTMTVQLGGNDHTGTRFEIVDRAWTKVMYSFSGEAPGGTISTQSQGYVHIGVTNSTAYLYLGSQGGGFGGNSSHNLRASGGTLMYNSGSGNHLFEIAGSQKGYLNASGWQDGSDIRLKENIQDISYGLDTVLSLKPRKFDWKDAPEEEKASIGFIAQEVESIIPEIISESRTDGKGTSIKGMNYGALTAALVKAIQEQQTIIDDLKSRIETLEG